MRPGCRSGPHLALLCAFQGAACIGSELLAHHVEPGGTVTVRVNGGNPLITTALADLAPDPAVVNGFSAVVTFGLVADGDTTGGTARTDLKQAGSSIFVTLGPQNPRTQLEVHAGGSGCVAKAATIQLHVDAGDVLGGDFQATGTVTGGSAACAFDGTLVGIPISR